MFPMFKELSGLCELNYLGKSLWQITASGSESKYSILSLSCWWMGDVALETNETPAASSLSMVSKLSLNEKNVRQWLVQWCLLEDLPGKVARVWNKSSDQNLTISFFFFQPFENWACDAEEEGPVARRGSHGAPPCRVRVHARPTQPHQRPNHHRRRPTVSMVTWLRLKKLL